MSSKYRMICAASCLLVGSCVWETLAPPKEIAAVLAEPAFREVSEVTHQGSLDGLEGCWGHHWGTDDGWTYAHFYRFEDGGFRKVVYSTDSGNSISEFGVPLPALDATVVSYYGGTYEEGANGESIVVTVTDFDLESSHPTGQTASGPPLPGGQYTEVYEISLDGDRMVIWNRTYDDAEDYGEGTLWRFDVCP